MEASDGVRNRAPQRDQFADEEEAESVEELRQRLHHMRSLVNDRPTRKSGIDDGFLSVVFGGILVIITFVAVYAFYHLFSAVYRRWSPPPNGW
ncbi:uncharacterized protein LOC108676323 [Hyalella azteca]|uniref:Uncharacterized protein LOC108676323 n=1 Tax=Hyalella azteca TaxID=294128 RepID=A0A8B7P493_HYAAZ|nr:uncharacterized protein LOC108676323 [Hyalella azteca]